MENILQKQASKKELITEIERLEGMALIYSSVDRVRTKELEDKIHELNMQLLDLMVDGNA